MQKENMLPFTLVQIKSIEDIFIYLKFTSTALSPLKVFHVSVPTLGETNLNLTWKLRVSTTNDGVEHPTGKAITKK
jgi:hypothetical protein